jgi:hypothetical protein
MMIHEKTKWDVKTPMEKMSFGQSHPQATPRRTLNLKHHPFRSCEIESN